MGAKLRAAPLYFTIVQVRFNSVLSLETYAPQIQERLRKDGFPDAQRGVIATINLNVPVASDVGSPPMPVAQARLLMGNMERTSSFILDPNALSFQTAEYNTFESFSADFFKGLEAVNDAVGLSYADRIGLRYLNAVFPKPGETIRDYFPESLLGLSIADGPARGIVHSFSETLIKADQVNVRSRVVIQDGEVAFPPDLQPLQLKVAARFKQLRGRHGIIDTDGWTDSREEFSVDRIRERIDLIHEEVERTFLASVTKNAVKAWA